MSLLKAVIYSIVLATLGGAAIVRVLIWLLNSLGASYFSCPLPVICSFDDPVSRVIEALAPEVLAPFPGGPRRALDLGFTFRLSHGSMVVALGIAVLIVRRCWKFARVRTNLTPLSFSGFAYGAAILGVLCTLLSFLGIDPILLASSDSGLSLSDSRLRRLFAFGSATLFLSFLIAEVSSLRSSQTIDTGRIYRRPIWTVLSIAFPMFGALPVAIVALSGQPDPGPLLAGLLILLPCIAIGLVAMVVAIVRGERLVPLQVIAYAINVGVGAPFLIALLPWGFVSRIN